ncbi:MAG TPA: hypothetical protein VKF39_02655, partial [Nitrososphaerales archaeon]|nr:hypothetical protein [Nitrososphaerales archaeon]
AGSTSVAVLDGGNLSFVRQIVIGHPILSIAYDSSVSQNLFVTSGNTVFSVNPRTGTLERNATFANDVDGIALDPANGRLFVGEYPDGVISVLNASSLAPLSTIVLPGCCALQFAIDATTQVMYAATGTNFIYSVNAATDTFDKSVQVAPSAQNSTNSIVVDNETGRVYVATSPGGSIIELDSAGNVVGHYEVQSQSQVAGMAVDTKTEELYATNYHQITVFDAARPRTFFFLIAVTGVVVAVAAIGIFLFLRRRGNRERTQIQSGRQTEGRLQ